MHVNKEGVYYEQNQPLVLDNWRDKAALVGPLCTALEKFSVRDEDFRHRHKTDWPSFRASQCRSLSEFQNLYLCINLTAVNKADILYDLCAQPRGERDITLHLTINQNAPGDEIERQVLKLFDACRCWTPVSPVAPPTSRSVGKKRA